MGTIHTPSTHAYDDVVAAETIIAETASTHIDDDTELTIWADGKVSIMQDYDAEKGEYDSAVFFKAEALPRLSAFLKSVQPLQ